MTNKRPGQYMLTLCEYQEITLKILNTLCKNMYVPRQQIIDNEDVFTTIVTEVMLADTNWNGHGTLEGYRKQRCIWAVKNYKSTYKNTPHIQSLDDINDSLGDTLVGDDADTVQNSVENEHTILHGILQTDLISSKQKEYIKLRLDNITYHEIGRKFGVTREAVRQSVANAVKKIKGVVNK